MGRRMKRITGVTILVVISVITLPWLVAWLGPLANWSPVIWQDYWTAFNNIVLLATLGVVSYYTYETYKLRAAAVDGNALAFRPIVIFKSGSSGITVNRGRGPAFNISVLMWRKQTLKITPFSKVIGVIAPEGEESCPYGEDSSVKDFKMRNPTVGHVVDMLCSSDAGMVILYSDFSEKVYYSYYDLSDNQSYGAFLRHGLVEDLDTKPTG